MPKCIDEVFSLSAIVVFVLIVLMVISFGIAYKSETPIYYQTAMGAGGAYFVSIIISATVASLVMNGLED